MINISLENFINTIKNSYDNYSINIGTLFNDPPGYPKSIIIKVEDYIAEMYFYKIKNKAIINIWSGKGLLTTQLSYEQYENILTILEDATGISLMEYGLL